MISKTRQLIRRSKYLSLIFLIMHLLGFISSIDAVMGSRTSQGAIAWVISLNTFPIIAVPSYWVLGRSKFQGSVTARQMDESKLSYIASKTIQDKAGFASDLSPQSPSVRAAELLADLPMLTGNSSELLIDGEATFASIFKGIEQAQNYILVQFFIFKDDDLGRKLKERLIHKARQGVRVYFLYDEVGSSKLPKSYIEDLRQSGVQALFSDVMNGKISDYPKISLIKVYQAPQGYIGG